MFLSDFEEICFFQISAAVLPGFFLLNGGRPQLEPFFSGVPLYLSPQLYHCTFLLSCTIQVPFSSGAPLCLSPQVYHSSTFLLRCTIVPFSSGVPFRYRSPQVYHCTFLLRCTIVPFSSGVPLVHMASAVLGGNGIVSVVATVVLH